MEKRTKSNRVLIKEALARSVSEVFPSVDALERELLSGRQLSFYFGIDPTSSHLHIGHAAGLWALRRFQDLGHKVILLLGDFTARIGDPTDKIAPRQPLTKAQVDKNLRTFKEQASHILNFSGENPAQVRRNSEWFGKMRLEYFIRCLLGAFSVQNLFARDNFAKRITGETNTSVLDLLTRNDFAARILKSKPIGLGEFIYPLLQGWDSRELNVDVEIGGRDQIFNMSVGRAFRAQVRKHQHESFFIAVKLLVDSSTGKKLSKTEASLINLDDGPDEMFGHAMALPDGMIAGVAELATPMPLNEIKKLAEFDNPRDAKLLLAFEIVKTYCGEKDAREARKKWEKLFSKKEVSELLDLPLLQVNFTREEKLLDVILKSGLAATKSTARRLIQQGSIQVTQGQKTVKVKNPWAGSDFLKDGDVVKIGKRHFFRVKVEN